MNMITILESEMTFGPFDEERFFHIESSDVYQSIIENVKMVEFILSKSIGNNHEIWLIEAKQSSPHPQTQPNWNDFIIELIEKFTNGLNVFIALCTDRHFDENFPNTLKSTNLSTAKFRIILVVRNHKMDWLPPLKDSLQQKLMPLCKSLNLGANPVIVLNEDIARNKNLIL